MQDAAGEEEENQPKLQEKENPATEPVNKDEVPELNNAKEEETSSGAVTNGHKDESKIANMVDLSAETHL